MRTETVLKLGICRDIAVSAVTQRKDSKILADHDYVISLKWGFTGNNVIDGTDLIDGCDLAHIVSIIEKQFAGEHPCFAIRDNKLCVILSKDIGEWNNTPMGYFDALVHLGLISSWKLEI